MVLDVATAAPFAGTSKEVPFKVDAFLPVPIDPGLTSLPVVVAGVFIGSCFKILTPSGTGNLIPFAT